MAATVTPAAENPSRFKREGTSEPAFGRDVAPLCVGQILRALPLGAPQIVPGLVYLPAQLT